MIYQPQDLRDEPQYPSVWLWSQWLFQEILADYLNSVAYYKIMDTTEGI